MTPDEKIIIQNSARSIEAAVDELKNNLRFLPADDRADAHVKMREAYDAIDRLRLIP